MTFKKKLLASGLAALALLATAGAASAASAVATANVNVRTGPGTGYAVIGTLFQGERVNVDQCRGSWCYIERRGGEGWVSSSYLSSGPGWDNNGWERPRPPRPPQWNPAPRPPQWNPAPRPPQWNPRPPRPQPVYPSGPNASFCFNGPNGYFCAGS